MKDLRNLFHHDRLAAIRREIAADVPFMAPSTIAAFARLTIPGLGAVTIPMETTRLPMITITLPIITLKLPARRPSGTLS